MTLITRSSHPYSLRDLRADHYAGELKKNGGVLDRYTDRWRFASADNAYASRSFLAEQPPLMTLYAPGQNSEDRSVFTKVGGSAPRRFDSVRGVERERLSGFYTFPGVEQWREAQAHWNQRGGLASSRLSALAANAAKALDERLGENRYSSIIDICDNALGFRPTGGMQAIIARHSVLAALPSSSIVSDRDSMKDLQHMGQRYDPKFSVMTMGDEMEFLEAVSRDPSPVIVGRISAVSSRHIAISVGGSESIVRSRADIAMPLDDVRSELPREITPRMGMLLGLKQQAGSEELTAIVVNNAPPTQSPELDYLYVFAEIAADINGVAPILDYDAFSFNEDLAGDVTAMMYSASVLDAGAYATIVPPAVARDFARARGESIAFGPSFAQNQQQLARPRGR
jgi:hypothetical protein